MASGEGPGQPEVTSRGVCIPRPEKRERVIFQA